MKYSVYEQKPIDFAPTVVVVACYVQYLDTYLFLRRANGCPQPNTWGVPAGKLDKNELPLSGMQRELMEETRIQADDSILQFLGDIFIRYHNEVDFIYSMFHLPLKAQPIVTLSPHEHLEYRWMSCSDIKESPLVNGASEAFDVYQRRLNEYKFSV